jgi:large subunit ribosomal protein L14e
VYKNFIQPGRVAYVNFGKDFGKVCVIVEIVDHNRVLVDGPTTGFPRLVYPIKRLSLTSINLPLLAGARTGTVK